MCHTALIFVDRGGNCLVLQLYRISAIQTSPCKKARHLLLSCLITDPFPRSFFPQSLSLPSLVQWEGDEQTHRKETTRRPEHGFDNVPPGRGPLAYRMLAKQHDSGSNPPPGPHPPAPFSASAPGSACSLAPHHVIDRCIRHHLPQACAHDGDL